MSIHTSWDDGYTSETNYTFFNYYAQFNPLPLKLHFLAKSLAYPKIKTACELGFGQGVSINMHAASSDIEWYGNDFNPDQVAFAQKIANTSKANIHLYDDSFEEFLKRDDLPQFDYIALHGIWSWINDENKDYIVEFIRKKLTGGGILYVSYNTLPGHSKRQPLREMMRQFYINCQSPSQDQKSRVDDCLNFVEELYKQSPDLKTHNPLIFDTINSLRPYDHNYLVHEYLNQNWDPMYFHEFAKYIEKAKVSYVCSSNIAEIMDVVNYNEKHKALFNSLNNPVLIETAKDFIEDRQFRTDIWIKGATPLTDVEKEEAIKDLKFIFTGDIEDVKLIYKGNTASVDLTNILNPILDLIKDRKIHSLKEILDVVSKKGFTFSDTIVAVEALVSQSAIVVAQEASKNAIATAHNLNEDILKNSAMQSKFAVLASPVVGGGFDFNTLYQLFYKAYKKHGSKVTAEQIYQYLKENLPIESLNLSKKGTEFDKNANKEEILTKEAQKFLSKINLYKNLKLFD